MQPPLHGGGVFLLEMHDYFYPLGDKIPMIQHFFTEWT